MQNIYKSCMNDVETTFFGSGYVWHVQLFNGLFSKLLCTLMMIWVIFLSNF